MCDGNNWCHCIPNEKAVYQHTAYNKKKCKNNTQFDTLETQRQEEEPRTQQEENNVATNNINKPVNASPACTISNNPGPSTNQNHQLIVDMGCTQSLSSNYHSMQKQNEHQQWKPY